MFVSLGSGGHRHHTQRLFASEGSLMYHLLSQAEE